MEHCEFLVSNCEMETTQFAITNSHFAMFVRLEGFEPTILNSAGLSLPSGADFLSNAPQEQDFVIAE
jgi:hypothetical protein